ncbi:MAG: 4Fe-4S dicluster domain-containing protein [Ruminococcus sp.]
MKLGLFRLFMDMKCQFLERMGQMPPDAWQHLLQVTENCTGCGICRKVCPSGSISLTDKKAIYTPGNCQTCLACIHACPHQAMKLTVPEKNSRARYRNEHVTLQEIIKANEQFSE